MLSRRGFLAGSAALLASCAGGRKPAPVSGHPFALGVASGSPTPDGVVLWTRIGADSVGEERGSPEGAVDVQWEVADDERFAKIVARGTESATPAVGHSVHATVAGLSPDRWYFYRFRALGEQSAVGRTRTTPALGASPARLRFAYASCQHFEAGHYAAYRDMLAWNPDLVLFLGDYIYENDGGWNGVRGHGQPEPITLQDYRRRYAAYRSDPHLQAMHAGAPWLLTWDDHEVENDYADGQSQQLDPVETFLLRRAAAYQAWYEHAPVRKEAAPQGPNARIFGSTPYGDLAAFHVLDNRQHRSAQPCPRPGRGGSNLVADCADRLREDATLLGAEQERWLAGALTGSKARWNVLAQQTLIAPLEEDAGPGELWWTDGWDGYPAARKRLLEAIVASAARNPVAIGGDMHTCFAANLHRDPRDPASAIVASEICGTSISSSAGFEPDEVQTFKDINPHLRYVEAEHRGYVRVELAADGLVAELRAVADVADADSPSATLATFTVEDGRPGVQVG